MALPAVRQAGLLLGVACSKMSMFHSLLAMVVLLIRRRGGVGLWVVVQGNLHPGFLIFHLCLPVSISTFLWLVLIVNCLPCRSKSLQVFSLKPMLGASAGDSFDFFIHYIL
jgi:hypothetical protein